MSKKRSSASSPSASTKTFLLRRIPRDVLDRVRARAHEGYTSMNGWMLRVLDQASNMEKGSPSGTMPKA